MQRKRFMPERIVNELPEADINDQPVPGVAMFIVNRNLRVPNFIGLRGKRTTRMWAKVCGMSGRV